MRILLLFLIAVQPVSFVQAREPVVQQLIPIVRIAPQYPRKAFMASISGWVKVKMMINARGSVDEVIVLDGRPRHVFDKEAIRAAMKFKFKPKVVDGVPVKAEATQTFDFDFPFPDQVSFEDKSKLINLMHETIIEMEPAGGQVILGDSVTIQSNIKAKDVKRVDFFYADDLLKLDPEPLFWQHNLANQTRIENFNEQLAQRGALVKAQYRRHPGIYRRFHTIYAAEDHPPELLSTVDYRPLNDYAVYTKHRLKLTLNELGQVTDWKSLSDKKANKDPVRKQRMNQFLEGLSFLPAIRNGQPVKDKIRIEFTTTGVAYFDVINESLVQNKQHVSESEWVKLGLLRDEGGHLIEVKKLAASDHDFAAKTLSEYPVSDVSSATVGSQQLQLIIVD